MSHMDEKLIYEGGYDTIGLSTFWGLNEPSSYSTD